MFYTAALGVEHGLAASSSEHESVFGMIGKYLFPFTSNQDGRRRSTGRRGSVESYDDLERNAPIADMDPEDEERLLRDTMTGQLERCLSEAKRSALRCQVLLIPRQMTSRVARDVVRFSAAEPCGLRGGSIMVYLDEGVKGGQPALKALGVIRPDPTVTPTFEMSLVLKADSDGWSPLKHLFLSEEVLKLRPEYRLVKRKLYSSASPVIHDFC